MTAVAMAPRAPVAHATLQTLQLGMEWFGENAGGLNRVYAQLVRELSRDGVELHGLVTGSGDVARASNGLVHAFAPSDGATKGASSSATSNSSIGCAIPCMSQCPCD